MSLNVLITGGRSVGKTASMKLLRERHAEIGELAKEKNVSIGWDNCKTYYTIYIEDKNKKRLLEEVVLVKGVTTVQMINDFYDIFTEKLNGIENGE